MSALGITRGNTRIGSLSGGDIAALTNAITQALDARRSARYTAHEVVMTALDDAVTRCNERRELPNVRALVDAGTIDADIARAASATTLTQLDGKLGNMVRTCLHLARCGVATDIATDTPCSLPLGHGGAHRYDG